MEDKKDVLGDIFAFEEGDEELGYIKGKENDEVVKIEKNIFSSFINVKKNTKNSKSFYIDDKYIKEMDKQIEEMNRKARLGGYDNFKISRSLLLETILEKYYFNKKLDKKFDKKFEKRFDKKTL